MTLIDVTCPLSFEDDLDEVVQAVGALIPDTPEAWAAVAMGCLDQAGLSLGDQDAITAILRRAGIDPQVAERGGGS